MKRTPTKWSAADPNDKVYWRSLDQLADNPEFRGFVQREFPAGASELSSPISRRSFMSLMGASLALAGLSGCRRPEEHILPYAQAPEDQVMGLPTYYASTITLGQEALGVLVESNEGRPTKIEGNPRHPMSLGGTSSLVQAAILELYDPDRSTNPIVDGTEYGKVDPQSQIFAAFAWGEPHYVGEEADKKREAWAESLKKRKDGYEQALAQLRGRHAAHVSKGGAGLRVLSGALVSPTLVRLRAELAAAMPEARWHTWEPVCDDAVRAGSRLAFGFDLHPQLLLEGAEVIVSLGADPLGLDPDALRNTRHFARRRRPDEPGTGMNRLYAVEASWTVTGATADHRLRVRPSEVGLVAVALAGELARRGLQLPAGLAEALPKTPPPQNAGRFIGALAADLLKSRGRAVITAGRYERKEVHALVHALNGALDATGKTVRYVSPLDAGRKLDGESLQELGDALDKGLVETLVVLGGNPAYDAPADLHMEERLKKAAVVHLGLYRDETAELAKIHIPRAHFLEAWGDARATDGTVSLVQPLIAPLYQGWSDIELMGLLLTGKLPKGYELVRETLQKGFARSSQAQSAAAQAPAAAPGGAIPAGKAVGGAAPTGAVASVAAVKTTGAAPTGAAKTPAAGAAPAKEQAAGTPGKEQAAAGAAGHPAPAQGAAQAQAPVGAPAPAPAIEKPQGPSPLELLFDSTFRQALRDGVVPADAGAPAPVVTPVLREADVIAALSAIKPAADGVELAFLTDYSVYDGRFANNGWLQELPDPITKMVWDNAALVPPRLAKELGLKTDDLIQISLRGRSVTAAVFILPGQADKTISLALGYGRRVTGRVGKGAGFNAYLLRDSTALGFDAGATIAATGQRYDDPRDRNFLDLIPVTGLTATQDHFSQEEDEKWSLNATYKSLVSTENHHATEGRPLIREASLTKYRKEPDFAKHAVHHPPLKSLWDEQPYVGQQWGLAIDLTTCTGCGACTAACQAENNIPIVGKAQVRKGREMHWIRVDRYFSGDIDDPEAGHQPVACMQCEDAPCENVCPVAATVHSADGLNEMAYNRCIGTRYCSNNCPYKVRRFNYLDWRGDVEEVAKLKYNPDVSLRSRGIMEKCTYCVQRIRGAQRDARLKGLDRVADGGITPACAQACPAEAIVFGDITDPKSRVAQLKKGERSYEMLAELNTKPRTSYLARIRNPNPELVDHE